jgi:hypothetical protein
MSHTLTRRLLHLGAYDTVSHYVCFFYTLARPWRGGRFCCLGVRVCVFFVIVRLVYNPFETGKRNQFNNNKCPFLKKMGSRLVYISLSVCGGNGQKSKLSCNELGAAADPRGGGARIYTWTYTYDSYF